MAPGHLRVKRVGPQDPGEAGEPSGLSLRQDPPPKDGLRPREEACRSGKSTALGVQVRAPPGRENKVGQDAISHLGEISRATGPWTDLSPGGRKVLRSQQKEPKSARLVWLRG